MSCGSRAGLSLPQHESLTFYIHLQSGGFAVGSEFQLCIHTATAEWTTQGDSQHVGSRQGEASCSHLDTQLGGAGDRTSNLPVTSPPALPPELLSHLRPLPANF